MESIRDNSAEFDGGALDWRPPAAAAVFGQSAPDHRAPDHRAPDSRAPDLRAPYVRAYSRWAALAEGRDFPPIGALGPPDSIALGADGLLFDLTDPVSPRVRAGSSIRAECGLNADFHARSAVPSGSLLSRMFAHCDRLLAYRAPTGFEAELIKSGGRRIGYRGLLMPYSSAGLPIAFVHGIVARADLGATSASTATAAPDFPPSPRSCRRWADGPLSERVLDPLPSGLSAGR